MTSLTFFHKILSHLNKTMFAVIKTGGKQYKVEKGATLSVEKIDAKEGSTVKIDKVLLISDKDKVEVGTPLVEGAYVEAKLVSADKGDKIRVFKMKAKKRYQKTQGHRQDLSRIEITDIKKAVSKKAGAKKED